MDRIGSYGIYQNNYYERPQAASAGQTASAGTKGAQEASRKTVELSSDAKALLKDLKKSYGNADFIVADYETEEEAASYLSRGTSQYSVLLTPEELEKMASDEKAKEENIKALDGAFAKLDEMKGQLGESGKDVSKLGVVLGDNGEVSYFAELEKVSEKQRERIEEKRENSREEAKKAQREKQPARWERGPESVKRTTVRASSVEALKKEIDQVDWNAVPERAAENGFHFNYFV